MTDAISIANAALLKATEALTRVGSHELECARRYAEGAAQNARQHAENVLKIETLDEKVDKLLSKADQAQGRSEANRTIFASIPGAFWQMIINLICMSAIAIGTLWFASHGKF